MFDEFLPNQNTFYTSEEHSEALGEMDQISLNCIVDSGSGGDIIVHIQHSADGIHWIDKNTNGEIAPTNNYNESNGSFLAGTTSLAGDDDGTVPNLGLVRLSVKLDGTATSAWVKIWSTGRDIR